MYRDNFNLKRERFYQFPAILCPTVTKRNWREKHREKFYQVLVIPWTTVQVNLTKRTQTFFSRVNSCCFLAHGIMQFNENSGFKSVKFWVLLCYQSVQLLGHVWIFAIPWTATCQASLSITNSQSLLKLISIESVMSSNHLILCCPLLFLPSIFPNIPFQWVNSALGGQSIGAAASASVLPRNIQDWFP